MDVGQVTDQFLARLSMPDRAPSTPFILGVIGNLGSGKSTVARMLEQRLSGSVVVCANAARYLLKKAGLKWGDNVRHIVREVAHDLLFVGYAVILDGSNAERDERKRTGMLGELMGIPVRYVRLNTPFPLCHEREKTKYNDASWISSFEHFRVGPTDKMLANLQGRRELHDSMDNREIRGLITTLSNSGTLGDLQAEINDLAPHILASL